MKKKIVFGALASLALFSCENPEELSPLPTCQLLSETRTSNVSMENETSILSQEWAYHYNSSNRVTRIDIKELRSTCYNEDCSYNSNNYSFQFTASGDQVNQVIYSNNSENGSHHVTYSYQYSDNQLAKIISEGSRQSELRLKYSSGQLEKIEIWEKTLKVGDDYELELWSTKLLKWSNGNITQTTKFSKGSESPQIVEYTYDSNPNPYKGIPIFRTDLISEAELLSQNNIIRIKDSQYGFTIYQDHYMNYNPNNLPNSRVSNGPLSNFKNSLAYTCSK